MAVQQSRNLRTAFKKTRQIGPTYTGGPVALTSDGQRLVSCVGEEILYTDISSGQEICRFAGDTEQITSLCITSSCSHLIVFTASLALRIFSLPALSSTPDPLIQPIRVVARAHDAPVHVCTTDPTSTYVASGSADGVVKVWDIVRGYTTHVFKGHGGVVSALTFNYPQDHSSLRQNQSMQLVTASVDTRIRIFELTNTSGKGSGQPVAVLDGHVSVPRGLDVSADGKWLVSGGRDSVVLIWDLAGAKQSKADRSSAKGKARAFNPTLVKTIPVMEAVEAVGLLSPEEDLTGASSSAGKLRFYTGGAGGAVKIWEDGNVLFSLGRRQVAPAVEQEEQRRIVDVIYLPSTSTIVSVHADQNIIMYSLSRQSLTRQIVGFNDEIVDATLLAPKTSGETPNTQKLALATNSSLIRVYSTESLDARLLEGHTDIVLSLDKSADEALLASSSKDRSIRLWAPLQPTSSSDWGYHCVGVCEGHAESVGALAFSRQTNPTDVAPPFLFSGSQDRTIKMWDISNVASIGAKNVPPERCKSLFTFKAHDKDINSLDISPNNRLLVSGSQDRTAKIYEIEYTSGSSPGGSLKVLGVCKGHKRGVWNVRFGRAERVLATGSGDKTVKLWSLDDFSCVKTFEGHTNSVLRVDFINAGMQLVSSASDGLVKVWNVRTEECTTTLDNHEDKVWALAVSNDDRTIISGAADSIVTFWEDCTEEQEQEVESKREEEITREQDFLNYLSLNDYRRAIQLALTMEQPGRLLNLFKNVQAKQTPNSVSGDTSVDEVLKTLASADLARLLRFVRDWNSNAKTSMVAQGIFYAIIKLRPATDIMQAFSQEAVEASGELFTPGSKALSSGNDGLREVMEALIPYTERHLTRMEKLVQESYMVDYILAEMDGGMLEEDSDDDMNVD